jgi:hypothetical protein
MSDNTNTRKNMTLTLSRGEVWEIVYAFFGTDFRESGRIFSDLVGKILTNNGIAPFGMYRRAEFRCELSSVSPSTRGERFWEILDGIYDSMPFRDLLRSLSTLDHGAREEQGIYFTLDHFPEVSQYTRDIPLFSEFLAGLHEYGARDGREGTLPFYTYSDVKSFLVSFTAEKNGNIRVTYHVGVPDKFDEDSEDLIYSTVDTFIESCRFWNLFMNLAVYRFVETFDSEGTTAICEDLGEIPLVSVHKGDEPDLWSLEFFVGIRAHAPVDLDWEDFESEEESEEENDDDIVPSSSTSAVPEIAPSDDQE